eukprot:06805.XXX_77758_77874_1 [CDS] Oithona nana genome sequencing.
MLVMLVCSSVIFNIIKVNSFGNSSVRFPRDFFQHKYAP